MDLWQLTIEIDNNETLLLNTYDGKPSLMQVSRSLFVAGVPNWDDVASELMVGTKSTFANSSTARLTKLYPIRGESNVTQ